MNLALIYVLLNQPAPTPPPAGGSEGLAKTVGAWLAIPATLATAVAAIYVVPQARLARRKTELDIIEKERTLGLARATGDAAEAATIVAEPILQGRRSQAAILRFIVFYLVLQVWGIVAGLFDARVFAGTTLIAGLINAVPRVIQALLFVGIGWPLLLDVTKLLRIELPRFVYSAAMRWLLILIAVLAALSRNIVYAGLVFFGY